MGTCCGGTNMHPEIAASKSIKELEAFLIKLKSGFPKEKTEIEAYLKDHSKEITTIKFTDKSESSLNKRVSYLDEFEPFVDKYIDALHKFQSVTYPFFTINSYL